MYATNEHGAPSPTPGWMSSQAHRVVALRFILAASITSTALHYAHNYVKVHHYPESDLASFDTTRLGILIVWPLLTAIGLLGYWLYTRHVYGLAHACIAAYSFLGFVTLGHFVDGSPDISPFWYGTIFTDALAGGVALAFVVWSAVAVSSDGEPRRAVAR